MKKYHIKHEQEKTKVSDQSLRVSSKADIEYLREGTVHQAMEMYDLLVPSNNTQAEVTKEALARILDYMFQKTAKIMRTASGLAVIKRSKMAVVTEVRQAIQIENKEFNHLLPLE